MKAPAHRQRRARRPPGPRPGLNPTPGYLGAAAPDKATAPHSLPAAQGKGQKGQPNYGKK